MKNTKMCILTHKNARNTPSSKIILLNPIWTEGEGGKMAP